MSTVAEPLEDEIEMAPPAIRLAGGADLAATPDQRRWFYGWLMLPLATMMMVATSPGQTFGIAYFNPYFLSEFQLTKTGLSSLYLVATLLASFGITLVGHLSDRYGLRRTVLCAAAAMSLICAACSQITGSITLFLAFLALRVTGPGTMTLLATNTLATWFDRRLGKVSSYTQIAMATCIGVVPMVFVTLIETLGWRGAYLAIGAMMGFGLFPLLCFFYRQSPQELGQQPDGFDHDSLKSDSGISTNYQFRVGEAMRHHSYWILVASTALWALIGTGLFFHLAAIFEEVGVSAKQSTRVVSAVAIVMGAMQLIGGILADRFAIRWTLLASMTFLTSGCCLFASAADASLLVASYLVFACSQGLMTIVANTAWARFYGRAHLGKIRGTSLTAAVAGSAVGPVIMGISADYLGGFGPSFWLFAGMALCVNIAAYWATPPEETTHPTVA